MKNSLFRRFYICLTIIIYSNLLNGQSFLNKNYSVNFASVKLSQLLNKDYLIITGTYPPWTWSESYSAHNIIRVDSTGVIKFIKQAPFGTTSLINTFATLELSNGNLVFAGGKSPVAGQNLITVYKTDSLGNLLWSKIIYSNFNIRMGAYDLYSNSSGEIIVVGDYEKYSSAKGLYFMRINDNGGLIEDYLIAGNVTSTRNRGFRDINGDFVWPLNNYGVVIVDSLFNIKNCFDVTVSNHVPGIKKVIRGYNNDYILVFSLTPNINPNDFDAALIAFDSTGTFKWLHKYPSTGDDFVFDAVKTVNNTYTISVVKNSNPSQSILLTVDQNGNLLSSNKVSDGGIYSFTTLANGKILTGGRNYLNGNQKVSMIVTDSTFQSLCTFNYPFYSDVMVNPTGINTSPCVSSVPDTLYLVSNNLTLTNITSSVANDCIITNLEEYSIDNDFNVFPNPIIDQLIIRSKSSISGLAEIFDLTGKKVKEKFINTNSGEINISDLENGFYILRFGEKQFKIVKQ